MMACLVMTMASCRETIENIFDSDDIKEGEEVMFTTSLSGVVATRADENYEIVKENYKFTIGMYTNETSPTKVSEGTYSVIKNDEVGTLKAENSLYWPSTTTAYGFKAKAGTDSLKADQTTKEKWLLQDRLEGDARAYKKAKDWKLYNESLGMTDNNENYKKIPLYMQHKRSLITIMLKAGEGVSRKALYYKLAEQNLKTTIYSYTASDTLRINPLLRGEIVTYDDNSKDSTACYEAIVMPYDYSANSESDTIAKISLSGQNYSFFAGNDNSNLESYKLTEGKNLKITITLGRESRIVAMSAYIEDWTEDVTTTICDDYGNAGDPIYITTKQEMIDFLGNGTKNKEGNVALVMNDITLDGWTAYDLRCTLNLGGHTLTTNTRFLNEMGESASLQNGTIKIAGNVDAAIATTNNGTIEDVKLTTDNESYATVAGAVITNAGTISKCYSSLKVSGASTTQYVGGIAATSTSSSKTLIIDRCTVTNRVDGGAIGGGIVGQANGTVTNNTFEYGITLNQEKGKYKNIIGAIESTEGNTFTNNIWPTKDTNSGVENVETNLYDGIIDSQAELKTATGSNRYRLAKDITVNDSIGDVTYELDGNGKQISTSSILFGIISGKVHDMTVYVTDSLVADNNKNDTDFKAPLAYAVAGENAEIRNVKVKMAEGTYIKAANPAGLVVWARAGAKISNCEVTADIRSYLNDPTSTQKFKFAGGIVSTASKATISQCVFHSASKLSSANTGATASYYGGIVGGVNLWLGETPAVTIADCTSFCSNYLEVAEDVYHGGILGYAVYEQNSTKYNATTKDCKGNWWPDNKDGKVSKGVAVCAEGKTVEATIGKRNAVKPTENKN